MSEPEILFETRGRLGLITLNRPKALNALTFAMTRELDPRLRRWAADPAIAAVVIRGAGERAFCAGGDIRHLHELGTSGRAAEGVAFWREEYTLNVLIKEFPKPYVALIDGIVMGGGVGVSFHGSHRVVTENAQFAMPEVGIGFFPDVGASHLLPALPGHFGMYLALTGNRIGWGDVLGCGLATHAIKAHRQEDLVNWLAETGDVEAALGELQVTAAPETAPEAFEAIARHFSQPSLQSILASIETVAASDPFAAKTLETILGRSPTSLFVAWREIDAGRGLSIEDCMRMEFRILNRMLAGHDFYEGIRAALVDKDRRPRWQPARIEDVSEAEIDAYFAPLGDQELAL